MREGGGRGQREGTRNGKEERVRERKEGEGIKKKTDHLTSRDCE